MKRYHFLDWNEENINHIGRHGVTSDEVDQVVFSSSLRVRKGHDVYYLLGQTESGRYLFIVLSDLGNGFGRVITAREMTQKEKNWYRQ